ncbi:MAG: 2-succinyl-5-enolpyruvyl-6-hydroxy-3-cyclohexene-1-carboxylic-acid synthase [Clostridiales bacterium]|nr:2-succinyl-5-enolpyruvyl-6-hydroxy-3-cyclohexene-1-carboxylic-acid synthase [Clostridiales bacterium]
MNNICAGDSAEKWKNKMYSSLKNIQILVALLKKYEVRHIVISAGTRHTPLVYSLEHDNFFNTYSVVDERSASFFAIGLIEKLKEPVAVCCTSGTAAANYVSAANEAFYQQLPLLLLTADRNHYYMFQQEEQMIPQENLYRDVCKRVVTLPHVRDDKDFWYCSRICNEALMELRHGEAGPVHINFIVENDYPIPGGIVKFDAQVLPDVRKTDRLSLEDSKEKWFEKADMLSDSKILIIYGQHQPIGKSEKESIEKFVKAYNCVVSVDLLSNLHCSYSVPTFTLCRFLNNQDMESLCPDVVITMNGNSISEIKQRIMPFKDRFLHIHVSAKGEISDPFKCLPDVIECSPNTFFEKFASLSNREAEHSYFEKWNNHYIQIGKNGNMNDDYIDYSSIYAVQQCLKNIPQGSLLHIANSNSIRIANYFNVNNDVEVYANRGSNGIDGSMSAFIGQSYISKVPSFLVIGDLSFFYDMNALWNGYVGGNVRILLCNNSGGAIFHAFPGLNNVPTLDEHIAAQHSANAEKWVISRGFKYLSAKNKAEFDNAMNVFTDMSVNQPVLLEVFTDKETDKNCIYNVLNPYHKGAKALRHKIADVLPPGVKQTIKNILK